MCFAPLLSIFHVISFAPFSSCLKLYCLCFSGGVECGRQCICTSCLNTTLHLAEIRNARARAMRQNRQAFHGKIQERGDLNPSAPMSPDRKAHKYGCKCSKSNCLKKYCECFNGRAFCGVKCRCKDCLNSSESSIAALNVHDGRDGMPVSTQNVTKEHLSIQKDRIEFDPIDLRPHDASSADATAAGTSTNPSLPILGTKTVGLLKRKRVRPLKYQVQSDDDEHAPATDAVKMNQKKTVKVSKPEDPMINSSTPHMTRHSPHKHYALRNSPEDPKVDVDTPMQAYEYMALHQKSSAGRSPQNCGAIFPIDKKRLVKQRIWPSHSKGQALYYNKVVVPNPGTGTKKNYYFVLHYDEELQLVTLVPLVISGTFRRNGHPRYRCQLLDTNENWIMNASAAEYVVADKVKITMRTSLVANEGWDMGRNGGSNDDIGGDNDSA